MPNDLCDVAEMTAAASPTRADARPSLLHHYEAIAMASSAMLAAARAGEWIEVARQEELCCALIATLKTATHSAQTVLGVADDARRMQLLRQILADDAQIRGHAEPWLEPLAPYISSPRAPGTNQAT
ncbi:MAG: flagellar protein FliT [Burkholderiaceae bacterium]|nr:flagellar protein FliT [Burkholderiaceae bacterium]